MNYAPPLYLMVLPAPERFIELFGDHAEVARLAWAKRAQLVRACEVQRWRCCYCERQLSIGAHIPRDHQATREHVVPKSRRGSDEDENIVAACACCNSDRGDADAYTFAPRGARIWRAAA